MVELSDSNKVAVFPYDGDLVIHKNRDFTFDGILNTGNFTLFGKQLEFVYDPFVVNLNKIDSLQYSIPSGFKNEEDIEVDWTVKTVLSDLVGTKISLNNGGIFSSSLPGVSIILAVMSSRGL